MGIKIGMVGLGAFGSSFAELYMHHPLVDEISLCDREPELIKQFSEQESWAKKLNKSKCTESYDDFCKMDLDAIVIMTQPWLHAPQCVQAMEAGKHVYSAVPVISVPDGKEILDWCDKIIQTSLKTGKHYMLGETSYYRPDLMFCRRKAKEGAFGDFVYVEGEYFHDVDQPKCSLRTVNARRTSSKSGKEWLELKKKYSENNIKQGAMFYPTHSCAYPVSIMNAHAVKVTCYGYKNKNNDEFFKDYSHSNQTALFEMSNGATARICEFRECAGGLGKVDETGRVIGTAGSYSEGKWMENKRTKPGTAQSIEDRILTTEEMQDKLPEDVVAAWSSVEKTAKAFKSGHGGSHGYLTHEFIDSVYKNRMPAINAWEAARYMAMGVMAHESALKDGERLNVPDWGDAPNI